MRNKPEYVCSECGAVSLQWHGQCPRCKHWNTLEQRVKMKSGRSLPGVSAGSGKPVSLCSLQIEPSQTHATHIQGLDRVFGSGLQAGGAVLIGGAPGVGKSTLLLQLAGNLAIHGAPVWYCSGEESLQQIKSRAERLGMLSPDVQAIATSQVEEILNALENEQPVLLIVDSVQTLTSARTDGLPGSVSQVRAVAAELVEVAKAKGVALLLVGHVTKDGHIAGPKLLEHMVDTVLSLEGEGHQPYRLLRVLKNRFGPAQELLVFEMGQHGMQPVEDPSTLFIDARNPTLSGAALVMAVDGRRPFLVETQALVSRSFLAIPRRAGLGFDVNRLHLLLAVMEKRLQLNMGQVDIYAKIGGGLRMQDPGLDLGLTAAVLSSLYDIPLPERSVFWGEVDLNGQIRPVDGHDLRISQAERLGYDPIICPRTAGKRGVETLQELQAALFGKSG